MNHDRWARSGLLLLLLIALTVPLLGGCSQSEPVSGGERKVLRVLGYEENWVRREWTQLYEIIHPDVTIEVLSHVPFENAVHARQQGEEGAKEPYEVLKAIMTGPNPPDVVLANAGDFRKLVEDKLLRPLDPYIEKDRYDMDGIVPAVREGLRKMGGGTLYGLAPEFTASALFYNKTIFDKLGLPYPKDRLTWEQVMDLARRLKHQNENGETVYGLSLGGYSGDLYGNLRYFAEPLGLSMFNADFTQLTVDTPEWERAWSMILKLEQEGLIPPPFDWQKYEREGKAVPPFAEHDFISGRAAMAIMGYGEMRQLLHVMNGRDLPPEQRQHIETFDWDVVSVPVLKEAPDMGAGTVFSVIMGINAHAQHPDLAWEYIAFMNGEEVAKVRSNVEWTLVSRKAYIKPPEEKEIHMEAFYLLPAAPATRDEGIYQKYPDAYRLFELGYQEFHKARRGEKTVKEALADFQAKGQEILNRLVQEQSGAKKH